MAVMVRQGLWLFSVTHHHACVETGWQLGALGPTVVADGAFRGWTVAHCVNRNLVMDSKMPPTSTADMCHNFAYKPSNSSPDILTAESKDLIKSASDFVLWSPTLYIYTCKRKLSRLVCMIIGKKNNGISFHD